MDYNEQQQHNMEHHPGRSGWVLIGFLLIGGFFLFTEHRAHVLGILPYLLLLACPLMHLFHHGRGHHVHRGSSPASGASDAAHPPQQEQS